MVGWWVLCAKPNSPSLDVELGFFVNPVHMFYIGIPKMVKRDMKTCSSTIRIIFIMLGTLHKLCNIIKSSVRKTLSLVSSGSLLFPKEYWVQNIFVAGTSN